jgi:site-specific recombinase XerD
MRNNAHSKNPNNLAWIAVHSFKAFLNYCLDNEWIERNPFTKSDWKYQKPTKVYLEEAEIQKLRSLDLSNNPRLAQARDLFLFSCATGVAYSDLTKIQKKDIQVFENELYLFVERQKTGVKGFIPLTEEAHQILVEYGYCLPITRYRTYNNNLQEIRALSGINKKITTHIGRKTFANIMLNVHNTPLEVVSKMMCHAEMETTALYYTEVSLAKVHQNTKHLFFNS